jgi:hypothetical protein
MDTYRDEPVVTAAAWQGAEVAAESHWIKCLSQEQLEALYAAALRIEKQGIDYLETGAADFVLPSFDRLSKELLQTLEGGLGFVLVRGFPVEAYDEQMITRMFLGLGIQLGTAEPQDAAGKRLHHVRDSGEQLEKKSDLRAYQTNRAINYHNDGSDIFALLCLRRASAGGRSKLVSAVSGFNELLHRRPDLACVLQRPFVFDARGQQLAGAPPCQTVPIFNFHAGYLNVL